MQGSEQLNLTVPVPADEWAACRKRIAYLETLLLGIAERNGYEGDWHEVERQAGLWGRAEPEAEDAEDADLDALAAGPVAVVPPWVLPLMRAVREAGGGDFAIGWHNLPDFLPAGMSMPELREAAMVLLGLGLIR